MCSFLMPKYQERGDKMQKINMNKKKTVIIAVTLILVMVISVFALNGVMQANKSASNESIAPYKYKMVLAYFEYWKDGNTYLADIPDENGKVVRKNIGAEPYQYVEWDYWFPVATLPGNYEIEKTMNLKDYSGSWADLNYTGGISEDEVTTYYMKTAKIENEPDITGATNTTVKFQASFRPLPPDKAKKETDRIYRCYIAIVIKYKNLDYIEPPEEPEEPEEPDPGDRNVMVYVYHKEKGTEKTLADMQKVRTSLGNNLVLSSQSTDGYKCISSSIKGLSTKNYETGYINEVVGRYSYTTPDDGYLFVTFYYEKGPKLPDYRCDPDFDADAEGVRIKMKRSDFNKAELLYFEGVHTEINGTKFGYRNGELVPGSHAFSSMDIYFKYGDSTEYDFQHNGVYSKKAETSLNVPKNKFEPTNSEKTEYRMTLGVQVGVFCECNGFEVDSTSTSLYVDIIENQPPDADYEYSTVKTLPSGQRSRVYNRAYIGKDVIIDNYCSDPNGVKDIDYVIYTFKNSSGKEKKIKFNMLPWIEFEQVSADNFSDTSIIYKGADNSNLNMIFTTSEEWEVSIYVQDLDGASDIYTNTIKPEVLSLKPTAVIKDTKKYRYPEGQMFNGKQNRVIRLDSNDSYVASWLDDMDVSIDHSYDMWKIEPLDGQVIISAKFEKNLNKLITGNILTARYEPLDLKMMFKESGRYKISLQVTDTEGNVSDWTNQIITIYEDLPPTVTADINPKYYREGTGKATITVKNFSIQSTDYDIAEIEKIEYQYDSNNDGNFGNWTNLTGISLNTSNLGLYQFRVTVRDSFGQETIQEHIIDSDYKRGNIVLQTEIDNIAPNVPKFKIMRTE